MLEADPINSALVISPHADDEALGAGGLIAKLSGKGVRVRVIFMAVDGFHHYGLDGPASLEQRKKEIENAATVLGYEDCIVYEGMDLIERLDTLALRELVDLFEKQLNEFKPDLVFLPHGTDFDQDHITCFNAGLAATRPIPENLGKHFAKKVLTYEMPKLVWSARPFHPTLYFDITNQIDSKLKAIAAYETQLREPPHVRSLENIKSLAYLRGSEIGVEFAEAYHVLRWVM